MRVFSSDLSNFWLSNKTATSKPLEIHQVHFTNENLRPISNNFVEIQNVELVRNRWSQHDFESVVPFRYKEYSLKTDLQMNIVKDRPKQFRDFKFKFNGLAFPKDFQPTSEYRYSEHFKSFVAQIPNKYEFTDPFYIKLVGDNMMGPYTHRVSTKALLYNDITKFYVLAEVRLVRNIGDSYDINFHYHQLSTHDMVKKYFYLFPIAVFIKSIVLLILMLRSCRKIMRTSYEYDLWYKIGIENELPEYLMNHRKRKNPEFLRRLAVLINIDDVIIWISIVFFIVFWVYFCFQQI